MKYPRDKFHRKTIAFNRNNIFLIIYLFIFRIKFFGNKITRIVLLPLLLILLLLLLNLNYKQEAKIITKIIFSNLYECDILNSTKPT